MNQFWNDILKEKKGFSVKRILILIFAFNAMIISVAVTYAIIVGKPIVEGATFVFAEILSFIIALVLGTVWAKHDKFQNPNTSHPEEGP